MIGNLGVLVQKIKVFITQKCTTVVVRQLAQNIN